MTKSLFAIATVALLSPMALPVAAWAQMNHGADGQMHDGGAMQTKQHPEAIEAKGVINTIDASARSINLSHEPIQAIGWPSMTMDMKVAEGVDLSKIEAGEHVTFTLDRGSDGIYVVTDIKAAK